MAPIKMFYNGIGFNGANTNCGIAHMLGILLMNSYDFSIFRVTTICHLFSLNWIYKKPDAWFQKKNSLDIFIFKANSVMRAK